MEGKTDALRQQSCPHLSIPLRSVPLLPLSELAQGIPPPFGLVSGPVETQELASCKHREVVQNASWTGLERPLTFTVAGIKTFFGGAGWGMCQLGSIYNSEV